ncbi:alpha/beta hydrolase-fold protein [Aureisphaera galaxeae]|uniref:alpha/beta hydrolase-fold protein n=1 Tax=Aureisphaera galaxeae TaxID=1538023 RepID=UPI00234FB81F|nr:alpha/beta hydrolase-fold protein [Aureisphaera galaxeae]MDC8004083.1 alpha/beta hydrolase-fold protein [Aureisphaera galaxeae]
MKTIHLLLAITTLLYIPGSHAQTKEGDEAITIGKKIKFYSSILGEEKELYISLPHKYEERVHSYPVIYALEAEFLFEPVHTVAKVMAARSKMPQSIVVGLANVDYQKRYEMNYERWGGKPDLYLEFFSKELIPFVEENYRANSHRTIIGLSPTNGLLYHTFLNQPEVFNGYIALAAQLEWERVEGVDLMGELMEKYEDLTFPKTTLYLGRADGDMKGDIDAARAFDAASQKLALGKRRNVTCKIDVLQNDEHYLMCLQGVKNGLATIYPNYLWKSPSWKGWDKSTNYAEEYYKGYYEDLSERYGFDIFPVEDGHAYAYHLTGRIQNAKQWGTNQQVIDLAELALTYYPNSAQLRMTLAEAYKANGNIDLALKTGEKAMEMAGMYHSGDLEMYSQRMDALKQ